MKGDFVVLHEDYNPPPQLNRLEDEVPVEDDPVLVADAGPEPGAVVIVESYASSTFFAVFCADWLFDAANGAVAWFDDYCVPYCLDRREFVGDS
jgi:hypothetical protein